MSITRKLNAAKMDNINFYEMREISREVIELQNKSRSIINLTLSDCVLNTHNSIIKKIIEVLKQGSKNYSSNYGFFDLLKAISNKLELENKINSNPNEILVTS